MNTYVLGILWALGRYVEDKHTEYFFLRHNREYFLQIVRRELGLKSNIHIVQHKRKLQYRLKVSGLDITYLKNINWQPRNSKQRSYPRIIEHRHFMRTYLEIHSTVDTMTIRKRNRPPYKQPRLRIYGNIEFLAGLNEALAAEIGIGIKKVQKATAKTEVSGILYYMSITEIRKIFDYAYRPPIEYFDRDYHEQFLNTMRNFKW